MIRYSATYTDLYELTMAQVYFQSGSHQQSSVFDYFFRKLPFDGGYAIFAGLETLLDTLESFRFHPDDLDYLHQQGFPSDFIEFLKEFRFRGEIWAVPEGEVVFPTEPILQVEAPIVEAQILETFLLNMLNFQTLVATKASRMRKAAGDRKLVDFGLRRAQSVGGYYASRAAYIGGFDATSNVVAGKDFIIPVSGTMAHSFIQSFDEELAAFQAYAKSHPDDCIFLVDTYDTLKSGLPNAIQVGKELEERGHRLKGIRLDSGDLAFLAKRSRKMLDDVGLHYVKIAASNQLDEQVIRSLIDQNAPIDFFGVGTNLVTGRPDAALDGVYKLAMSNGAPRIKLSETIKKTSLPDRKQVFRISDDHGHWIGADVIGHREEQDLSKMYDPFEPARSLSLEGLVKTPLLQKIYADGKRLCSTQTIEDIKLYSAKRLDKLPDEYKRFEFPHIYKVGISQKLLDQRDTLMNEEKKKS